MYRTITRPIRAGHLLFLDHPLARPAGEIEAEE